MNMTTYTKTLFLCGLVASLSACDMIKPYAFKKTRLNDEAKLDNVHTATQKEIQSAQKNQQDMKHEGQEPYEIYKGTGVFVDKQNEHSAGATRKGTVTLDFENAELVEVVRIILNDTLKVNYVIDPRITGKVSLRTAKPLAPEELLSTLEMLLQINNAALIKNGNSYRIQMQSAESGSKGLPKVSGGAVGAGSQVRIIPLLFVGAKQMNEILKPVLSNNALLRADSGRNLLMVAGTAEEIAIIEETVNIFDVNTMQGMSFGLFPLNSVDPETINKELAEVFGYNTAGPLEDMFRIVPIERLNSILVITPQAQYLEQIKVWLSRLDRTKKGGGGNVHVYRAQHMKALDLANTLNDIFGQARVKSRLKTVKKGSVVPNQKSASVTNKAETDKSKSTSGASANIGSSSAMDTPASSGVSSSSGNLDEHNKEKVSTSDVRIIPDELNNSLVIVANELDYRTVHDLIKQLDIMPLQVHIDASILSVDLDDSLSYGVDWKFKNSLGGKYQGIGTSNSLGDLAKDAMTYMPGGFSYMISKASNIEASLHAVADEKNIHVVSSPSLMVLNNQEASIQVGDKIPVLTGQSFNTSSGNNNVTNLIEMIETGVTLNVTPRVNASGVVIMEIDQSVDNVSKSDKGSTINSPSILKRSIKTTVAVDNNETIVLGGLISEEDTGNKSGIPLLMDIPWIGDLFSSTGRGKKRSELIVLITPQVLQNKNDARAVAQEYKQRLQGIYQK